MGGIVELGTVCAGCSKCANLCCPGAKKICKKTQKVLDGKAVLPYCNSMTNDFANISAESNLSDMIALRIEDFTGPIPESWGGEPMELTEAEKAEANAWFDERRDSWMMELVGTI